MNDVVKPRYQTVTVHGDLNPRWTKSSDEPPNACAYVYDRLLDCMVASYPTERGPALGQVRRGGKGQRQRRLVGHVEMLAQQKCDQLNAADSA